MRNGDLYKIKSMEKSGVSDSDICQYFRNRYDADEIGRFLTSKPAKAEPEPEVVDDVPKAKKKTKAKAKAK